MQPTAQSTSIIQVRANAALAADAYTQAVDMHKHRHALWLIDVGAATGSPDGSNKHDFQVRESDDLVAANFTALDDGFYLTNRATTPTGIGTKMKPNSLDAAGDFSKVHFAGTRQGKKRYQALFNTKTGTISAPVGVVVIGDPLGEFAVNPTAVGIANAGLALS